MPLLYLILIVLHSPDSTSNNTNNNQTNTNNYSCGSNLYNCTDFSTQSEAQTIYNKCMQEVGKDIHKLDRDNNGIACESN